MQLITPIDDATRNWQIQCHIGVSNCSDNETRYYFYPGPDCLTSCLEVNSLTVTREVTKFIRRARKEDK